MDLLIPDSGLLFWMALVFFVVLFILWKWGFPVIIGMVNDRKTFIDESIKKAHEANERLANIKQEGESILQQAREQQALILKEAGETKLQIIQAAQEKAKEETTRIFNEAKAEVDAEKQNAIRDIRAHVAQLSVLISEKILKEKLDNYTEQMDLIERLLDDITVKNN